ncbi:hypothetical protein PF010_g6903 [Phytophthora fragariae]|uniref:ISXO2-like transposase domain-containing protein n=1 Tax=Phytophthora fragariae TaxID=53985 RepID=A0A6G0PB91_9STRA|nr:hypothetical protein PF010_g6903 [Phytophthora fragariae]KAE9241616.1 hypothetical protein PF004_g6969 [Phytophthora fragariae]
MPASPSHPPQATASSATSYEYDVADNTDYTHDTVMAACLTEESAAAWCRRVGLLANRMACPKCANAMRLTGSGNMERWRCGRPSCRVKRSARANSFFSGSRAKLRQLVKILWFWATQTPAGSATEFTAASPTTITQWYTYARDVCSAEMLRCDMEVGGVGHVVEIDETSLRKKQKYNRGKNHPDFWVFGGVDRATKKWFAKVVFNDRTKPLLSAVIKKHIHPGTLIMSDMGKAYVTIVTRGKNKGKIYSLANNRLLRGMRYQHLWVNHTKNFRDPDTGAHTNRIEGVWEVKIKQRMKSARGMAKTMVAGYLDECLWRSWYFREKASKADYVHGLVIAIRKGYPV